MWGKIMNVEMFLGANSANSVVALVHPPTKKIDEFTLLSSRTQEWAPLPNPGNLKATKIHRSSRKIYKRHQLIGCLSRIFRRKMFPFFREADDEWDPRPGIVDITFPARERSTVIRIIKHNGILGLAQLFQLV